MHELEHHRTDHAVVGALTARAWKLPGPVMAAIRLHHSLESLGGGNIEPEVQTLVVTSANHWDLLDRAEVTDRMRLSFVSEA